MLVIYLILAERTLAWSVVAAAGILAVAIVGFRINDLAQITLPVAGGLIGTVCYQYIRKWNGYLIKAQDRRESIEKASIELKDRFEARVESLHHLEERVSGLLRLFEIARDFNECLSFSDLHQVLETRIAKELTFKRGALILIHRSESQHKEVSKLLQFGDSREFGEVLENAFIDSVVNTIGDVRTVVHFDELSLEKKKKFAEFNIKSPTWFFPLFAEDQLIGVLEIGGGKQEDLPTFELLASQLLLQVKKIALYETVKEISIVDGLTKTFVRRYFLERFREELKRAVKYEFPITVLMVDVDDFKSYNDKFGHLVGDKTLLEVASVLRENVRPVDVIGRYGGEEFIIVAPEANRQQGLELAERIRSSVARKKFHIYDEETRVTISVGACSFPDHLSDGKPSEFKDGFVNELIQKADQALYRAKDEGRNRVVEFS